MCVVFRALHRWGGASFEQNQSRQICVNPYDQEFEKKVRSIRRGQEVVKFDDFLKIIDCNFTGEKQSGYQMADVEAYMARSNIVVLTEDWMYLWLASTTKDPVPRFQWPVPEKPDLFTPETTPVLKRFKKDQTFAPPDYDAHMKWAVAAMKKLARGEDIKRGKTIRGPTLFDQDAPPRYDFAAMDDESGFGAGASAAASAAAAPASARSADPGAAAADEEEDVFNFGGGMDGGGDPLPAAVAAAPPAPAAAIKMEPGVFRQRLKKSKDWGVIDLGTPTPKKKRTDLDDALSQMLEEDGVTGAAAASGSAGAPA